MKFKVILTLCCNRCILTQGGMDKNHPGQNLPGKRPLDKSPRTKALANNRERICTGFLSGCFVLGLLKLGGSEMCDVLWGVMGCVTKCDRGRGVKIGQK